MLLSFLPMTFITTSWWTLILILSYVFTVTHTGGLVRSFYEFFKPKRFLTNLLTLLFKCAPLFLWVIFIALDHSCSLKCSWVTFAVKQLFPRYCYVVGPTAVSWVQTFWELLGGLDILLNYSLFLKDFCFYFCFQLLFLLHIALPGQLICCKSNCKYLKNQMNCFQFI